MSKTLDSACLPALRTSAVRWGLAGLFLAAMLSTPPAAQAQTLKTWQDEFLDRSKIESLQNATIDTVQGLITLSPIRETNSQGQNFRAVLSGVDRTFFQPTQIRDLPLPALLTVEDIDSIPGQPNLYMVTDSRERRVFIYNAESGLLTSSPNIASSANLVNPKDSFPFIEGNNVTKFLVTDKDQNRIFKINSSNSVVEWSYGGGGVLLSPLDAVVLPASSVRPSQEVLICDSGNNRIIAVDTTTDAITFNTADSLLSRGEFNNPIDVDFDPTSPANAEVYLVTDQLNHRVVLLQRNNSQLTTIFGVKGKPGNTDSTLTQPTDADPLPNGNILICDAGNNRLIEVNRQRQIVWQFAHTVFDLRDADRIRSGNHANKTLAALRDSATANPVTAKRFGYESGRFVSQAKDFGQQVDFDTLRWSGITEPPITGIRLQLRTVRNLSDTSNAPWLGPSGPGDYYTATVSPINPIHDGDRYYQFRAFLDTQDRLKTPELRSVEVKATFFRADTQGVALSKIVRDSSDTIITSWRTLAFTTELPIAANNSIVVDVMDSLGTTAFASFQAGQAPGNRFDINPVQVPGLQGHQALRLRATLRTTSPFVSPKLLSWSVEWNSVKLGPSQTSFVNPIGTPTTRYRVSGAPGDSVYARVVDPNVLPLRDSVQVEIRSSSGDSESIFLFIDRVTRAAFRNRTGLRLSLTQPFTANNGVLEVADRDNLTVSYVDPLDPNDTSSATALVIQRTVGMIQIENMAGVKRDTVGIGETVFVRVFGETDQSLSPTGPDTLRASIFDPRTTDNEQIILVEQPDGSGNFRTTRGILLSGVATQPGDGRLYVTTGSSLTARYQDPSLDEQAILATAFVGGAEDVFGPQSSDKFIIQIAPNPYRASTGLPFKMRAQVRAGMLTLRQVEIFNLAGERIKTIPDGQITFGGNNTIQSTQGALIVLDWWNLLGDDNRPVATGTYFAKFHVTLQDTQGAVNQVTDMQKLVILQQ